MPEKFVDTLSEKVMVVITVDIIVTFKNHQRLQADIKARVRDAFVCKHRVSTVNTWA